MPHSKGDLGAVLRDLRVGHPVAAHPKRAGLGTLEGCRNLRLHRYLAKPALDVADLAVFHIVEAQGIDGAFQGGVEHRAVGKAACHEAGKRPVGGRHALDGHDHLLRLLDALFADEQSREVEGEVVGRVASIEYRHVFVGGKQLHVRLHRISKRHGIARGIDPAREVFTTLRGDGRAFLRGGKRLVNALSLLYGQGVQQGVLAHVVGEGLGVVELDACRLCLAVDRVEHDGVAVRIHEGGKLRAVHLLHVRRRRILRLGPAKKRLRAVRGRRSLLAALGKHFV